MFCEPVTETLTVPEVWAVSVIVALDVVPL